MTTSTPYAPARLARVQMRRLRRGAGVLQGLMRAAMLATVLTSLALGLGGALKSGSAQVASTLDQATQVTLR